MGTVAKSIFASSTIVVLTKLSYSTFNALLASPNIEMYLEAEGYTSLFNTKKDNFAKWKRNYSFHQKELEKLIPELRNSKQNGAFLLKQWCKVRLNQVFSSENYSHFDLTKKYCTLNIQNAILENDDLRTIDEITAKKRKQIFGNKKELLEECRNLFKIPYNANNRELLTKTKNMCSTENWI